MVLGNGRGGRSSVEKEEGGEDRGSERDEYVDPWEVYMTRKDKEKEMGKDERKAWARGSKGKGTGKGTNIKTSPTFHITRPLGGEA